jgi:hypothetical protein
MPLKIAKAFGLLAFVILLLTPSVSRSQSVGTRRVLVEVWSGGDDGLTQRLKAAVEREFKRSSSFELSEGKRPRTLIVTIPTNVDWRRDGKRTRVSYSVDFTSTDGEKLGSSKGSCWDENLVSCSRQILSAAKLALRKSHVDAPAKP